ncbi:MAG: DUF2147 domain-containing protein [Brucellaceae bacterium]|nr:DUF2147 domain-containing protein [Brucellaceae bacterium]
MKKLFAMTALAAIALTGAALADPIEGKWKREEGTLMQISKCGGAFCVDVASGEYKGQRSGKLSGANGTYSGTLKQLSSGISFSGKATISGNRMKLVAKKLGITVKTENWVKQ